MDKVKCPICYTEVEERDFKETYVSPYNNQEYKRYECPNCDVHWWEPLKIIPEFYESEVFEHYIVFHECVGTKPREYHKVFFKHFPSNVRGKLLDVGCGDGRFLRHAKEQGFEVWGIDFDKKSVENVKRNLGIDTVFAMSLEEFYEYAKERNLKFDVITFFEVLEHQDKPREFLEMVKGLLREGGYIAGSVPNRETVLFESLWKYTYVDLPPHHFLRFSQKSLENAIKLSGFEDPNVFAILTYELLYYYIEIKLLGRLYKLRNLFKGLVLGDKRKAIASVDDIIASSTSRSEKIRAYLLKGIRLMRNALLFPFAFAYIKKAQHGGPHLYFQARKPNN
ncbi:MAG: class I SAM-dependent methyltransferase [Thermocrinis sp.]|jgi:2-polyprenyl-3-methyl-5-hydroxy-6-metoxy-1,4-benzoquinol methylase|uniref:class I SAM-dependent methyltransferase n=1 Tax=Thermocrinis sp. TaxID=2024383 RepID=UPI003C0A3283